MPAVDDFKALNKFDQAVLGAGVLAFIVSFFPFYGSSGVTVGGQHFGGGHITAWHGWAGFGMFLVLVATLIAAARIFAPSSLPTLPVGLNLLTLVLAALGTFMVIVRGLTYRSGSSYGVRWGGYLLFLLLLVQVAAAVMLFKSSGEKMPDFKAMQANRAAGAVPPPPAPGMTPPPPAATYPPATPAGDFTLDDTNPPTH